jgi:hypothetical protein
MKVFAAIIALCLASFGQIGGGAKVGGGATIGGQGNIATPPTSGMQFWWNAPSSVCTGGCSGTNPVTTFTDKSPAANNATATTAGTWVASAVNSQPGVLFNGSSTLYTFGSTINIQTASTMFVVLKLTATGASGSYIVSGGSGAMDYYFSGGTGKEQGGENSQNANLGNGTAANDTSYHQMNYTYDGTTITFRLGRASDGSASPSSALSNQESSIGNRAGPPDGWFNGTLVELIIYNRVLSGGEITTVETYLNARYGL